MKRRDFVSLGIITTVAHGITTAQDLPASGRFKGGDSALHLEAPNTRFGPITLDVKDCRQGTDRTFIAQGTVQSKQVYRGVFSRNSDEIVFANLRDDNHSTTITLWDDPSPSIGHLTVFNDNGDAQHFRIDISRFLATGDQRQSILDGKGQFLDQIGNRQPIVIPPIELFNIFGDLPEYKLFMRGEVPDIVGGTGGASGGVNWKCAWICLIPACGITCLFWSPLKKTTQQNPVFSSCNTICFRSPQSFLLNPPAMPPGGNVLIGGVNYNSPTDNPSAIEFALRGGSSPLQQLNQQFVAAQLSIVVTVGISSPSAISANNSPLTCYALNFPPVTLSNGYTLTPNSTLGSLFEQARLAILENRTADMTALANLLKLLSSNCKVR